MRALTPVYAFFVALFTIWSWGAVWNSMNERREFFTSSELLLYLVTLPTSVATMRLEHWAQPIFPWLYVDVAMLTLAGMIQVTLLYVLAFLVLKRRHASRNSSANGS
ncbi:hypothetical protein [Dyella sp. ASV21]|uniref:hypothetical protein n=1 Tax=Dyella sp. ASV21 TaxID=2795114 RepID=UPI0018ED7887|nr:hypothetical protein [Dyella sp. ASV21]